MVIYLWLLECSRGSLLTEIRALSPRLNPEFPKTEVLIHLPPLTALSVCGLISRHSRWARVPPRDRSSQL